MNLSRKTNPLNDLRLIIDRSTSEPLWMVDVRIAQRKIQAERERYRAIKDARKR